MIYCQKCNVFLNTGFPQSKMHPDKVSMVLANIHHFKPAYLLNVNPTLSTTGGTKEICHPCPQGDYKLAGGVCVCVP